MNKLYPSKKYVRDLSPPWFILKLVSLVPQVGTNIKKICSIYLWSFSRDFFSLLHKKCIDNNGKSGFASCSVIILR